MKRSHWKARSAAKLIFTSSSALFASGYELELHYLWLSNVEQAIARVRRRVRMGGHDVPVFDIRRRFKRSLIHLLDDFLPLATRWAIWDNRGLPAKRMAMSATDDIDSLPQLLGL